ncbi:MAG: signal peptidase II [Spirochaetia bacterium]
MKALLILLIVLASIGCDQATKQIARTRLMNGGTKSAEYGGTKSAEYGGTVFVVDSVLVLHYVENEGGFLSLGARLPRPVRTVTFVAFPLLILFWIIFSLARNKETGWTFIMGFSFIAGGGLGNLIDRLFRDGKVSDFIIMGIGTLRTGVFNLADLSVLIGCLLLLASPWKTRQKT